VPPVATAADVVIIGGGPGGYVAAIRAAQLGLSTVCVEQESTLGGTCVNVGCIPSKALLASSEHYEFARRDAAAHGVVLGDVGLDLPRMLRRKDDVVTANTRGIEFLFRKHRITWARGRGSLAADRTVTVTPGGNAAPSVWQAAHVIIATGSVAVELPFLPFDESRIVSNVGALTLARVPDHLIVVGGGAIGLELGSVWRRLGARVTVLELAPSILPGFDADIVKEAEKIFRKQGLDLRTGVTVTGATRTADGVRLETTRDGATESFDGDVVLVAVGRRPNLAGIDATALGLDRGRRGEILVDARLRTNLPGVFAIGDVAGGKLLAHKAEEEGIVAAEVIAGHDSTIDYRSVPGVVYTWPEIASVGLAEHEARASGRPFRVGRFPYSANGRARTAGETTGFVKFIADAETDELIGAHLIGPTASELVAEIVLAFEYRATAEDLAGTIHAHPTLAEATREAALAVHGRALHF